MSEVVDFCQSELRFFEVGEEPVVGERLQDVGDRLQVFSPGAVGGHANVVDEPAYLVVVLGAGPEDALCNTVECCACVGQSKRHTDVLEKPVFGGDGSLRDVLVRNQQLSIGCNEIDRRLPAAPGEEVEVGLDAWGWPSILDRH